MFTQNALHQHAYLGPVISLTPFTGRPLKVILQRPPPRTQHFTPIVLGRHGIPEGPCGQHE